MRALLFVALAALLSLVLSAAAGELFLRLTGRGPLVFQGGEDFKPHYRPHPRLGWVHVPGRFQVGGAPATFLEDGSRASAAARPDPLGRVLVLVGGSFTEGYGVSDEDTFAWRLQERLPDTTVLNFGTGGHGTLQSLVTMEEQLPRLAREGAAVSAVVYGYIQDHALRNIAHWRWRHTLNAQSRGTDGEPVRIPYARLDEGGRLVREPPRAWPAIAWSTRSALAYFAVGQWVRVDSRTREGQSGAILGRLLGAMHETARRNATHLMVAVLWARDANARFVVGNLRRDGVAAADCRIPGYDGPRYHDPVTAHPTPMAHAEFASCIARALEREGWLSFAPADEPPGATAAGLSGS